MTHFFLSLRLLVEVEVVSLRLAVAWAPALLFLQGKVVSIHSLTRGVDDIHAWRELGLGGPPWPSLRAFVYLRNCYTSCLSLMPICRMSHPQ